MQPVMSSCPSTEAGIDHYHIRMHQSNNILGNQVLVGIQHQFHYMASEAGSSMLLYYSMLGYCVVHTPNVKLVREGEGGVRVPH